jgi:hypothetical protein
LQPGFFIFTLGLKADSDKAPKNLKIKLINLQWDINLNQKFYEMECAMLLSPCAKRKVKNDCNVWQHLCM